MAARSGDAGWNGSRALSGRGQRPRARCSSTAAGTRASSPVTAAAAVRLCAQ